MSFSKKSLWMLLLTFTLALVLAACAGGDDSEDTSKSEDTGTETNTDSGTTDEAAAGGDLIIAELSDASSLDPHGSNDVPSSNVQSNLYETLVNRDANGELVPGLADSWNQVDDLTWEFKLKQGVTFHDGEAFNAEAVKASFDRLLDPEVGSPRAFLFEMVTEVKVVDESTVQFITEYPFSPLLAHLTHNGGSIISPKSIEEDYAAMEADSSVKAGSVIGTNPVGTGPFKFESWTPGTEIKLVKFAEYAGTPVHIDSVTFKVVPESATRVAEIQSGYAHIIGAVEPGQVANVNSFDGASVLETASSSLTYLGFNTEKEPFNDPKVRQAISKAIDRPTLIEGIYEGYGIPAISPLAPGIFGYTEDVTSMAYNMDEAKALLEEAGYADGFKTTIWTNDNPARQQVAIVLQENLKQLNIQAEIEVMEFGSYLEKTAAGEHDMFILGWSNPTGDADYGLYALFHSSQHGDPGNRSFYSSDKVDELLEKGRREADPAAREAIYKEALQLISDESPMAFVLHPYTLTGVSDKVSGFNVGTDSIYQLREVKISE
ncbi:MULTISPECIES: glutathione ABC transporter substrate-binding protein [Solibacillus]|uniref:Glutathione ABC transporter substrate-binding protein n=1 Tax=Solibacillus faecavium TaxID=2762221 RepID=A0ABR8Y134_9BACL|nr:glutathione ABC transporter substrate-binding protein [Solibacillus faecavium]MBD8037907.1 glutathione ABC transporter substrate-binding protein [Solibacillus faecavium]